MPLLSALKLVLPKPESNPDPSHWYVVQTEPRQEYCALEQLQSQHYTCFLPMLHVKKIIAGKLATAIEPLFSRHLFIRLDAETSSWGPIRSTRGVSGLVVVGGSYATLPDDYVAALQNEAPGAPSQLFEVGDAATITQGPLAGLNGVYQLPDGEARAFVLIELMRQPHKLSFALEALR